MTQTTFIFHWVGLAILLQLHMEIYVYKRKSPSSALTLRQAVRKLFTSILSQFT